MRISRACPESAWLWQVPYHHHLISMKLQRNFHKSNLNATWERAKSFPFWELLTKSHLSEMGGWRISSQDAWNQGIGRESSSLQQSPDWEWGMLETMNKCAQEENLCIWKPGTKQRAYMLFLPPAWVHGVFPNWHSFWSMFMSICVCSPHQVYATGSETKSVRKNQV
jgi:hypothetical protein